MVSVPATMEVAEAAGATTDTPDPSKGGIGTGGGISKGGGIGTGGGINTGAPRAALPKPMGAAAPSLKSGALLRLYCYLE